MKEIKLAFRARTLAYNTLQPPSLLHTPLKLTCPGTSRRPILSYEIGNNSYIIRFVGSSVIRPPAGRQLTRRFHFIFYFVARACTFRVPVSMDHFVDHFKHSFARPPSLPQFQPGSRLAHKIFTPACSQGCTVSRNSRGNVPPVS